MVGFLKIGNKRNRNFPEAVLPHEGAAQTKAERVFRAEQIVTGIQTDAALLECIQIMGADKIGPAAVGQR